MPTPQKEPDDGVGACPQVIPPSRLTSKPPPHIPVYPDWQVNPSYVYSRLPCTINIPALSPPAVTIRAESKKVEVSFQLFPTFVLRNWLHGRNGPVGASADMSASGAVALLEAGTVQDIAWKLHMVVDVAIELSVLGSPTFPCGPCSCEGSVTQPSVWSTTTLGLSGLTYTCMKLCAFVTGSGYVCQVAPLSSVRCRAR